MPMKIVHEKKGKRGETLATRNSEEGNCEGNRTESKRHGRKAPEEIAWERKL